MADDATFFTAMASWLRFVALLSALLAVVTASPGFEIKFSRFVEPDRQTTARDRNSRNHVLALEQLRFPRRGCAIAFPNLLLTQRM